MAELAAPGGGGSAPKKRTAAKKKGNPYNEDSLRWVLWEGGFRGDSLDMAYAIAMAESGGNARAHNGDASTGDNSYGLFQINMLGDMGPARREQYGLSSNADLYDPVTNAKIAYKMSNGGQNWQPWSAYTNGSYEQYLDGGNHQVSHNSTGGGSGGGGGGSGGGGGDGGGVHLSQKDLAARYGFTAEFLNQHGAIENLIDEAVREGWSDDVFVGHLKETPFYQKHDEAERSWILLQSNDPATARKEINDREREVNDLARQLGVGKNLSKSEAHDIAMHSLRGGWDQARLQRAVGNQFEYDPERGYKGVAGATIDDLNSMASAYLVPISDQRMENWTTQVLRGQQTVEGFESYMKDQAKSLYPYMSDFLDTGGTVAQWADPYIEMAATELGIPPSQVDLRKPMWSAPLTHVNKDGQRTAMSLADWQTTLRTDSRYKYDQSANAIDQAAQFASSLSKLFGATA